MIVRRGAVERFRQGAATERAFHQIVRRRGHAVRSRSHRLPRRDIAKQDSQQIGIDIGNRDTGVAVAVEALSDHPLAAAVVRDGEVRLGDQARLAAQEVQSLTGQGVQAQVTGQTTTIGKPAMFLGGEGAAMPAAR